jgi:hypothetical protein
VVSAPTPDSPHRGPLTQAQVPFAAEKRITKSDGTNQIFQVSSDQQYQYLLVFLTDLPAADDGSGEFKVSVNKIQVDGS